MGFPENKKLAKDINTVNTECADRLGALMTQMSGRMDTANRILEGIASEETRTVYKPSVAVENEVLPSQVRTLRAYSSSSYSVLEEENFICPNVFEAAYNGEVTFYISYEITESSVSSYAGGEYTVKQIYPFEVQVLKGNIPYEKGSGHDFVNFAVVEGAIYQIEFYLSAKAGGGAGSSASVTARASIRAIEETITGTKTQYYYPAEGAPEIWSDNTVQDMTTEKTVDYSFTPECDGVALLTISCSSISSSPDFGVAQLTVNCPGENSQTLEVSKENNLLCSSQILLYKGKPHTIHIYNSNWRFVIDYVAISAIKTTSFPIVVPFKNVENPVSVTIELDGVSTTGYIVKKLPQVPGATYMITSDAAAYPVFKSHCLMYNMVKNKVDYHLWKNTSDEGWDCRNRAEAYNTTMLVAVAFIDGEYCLFAHGSKAAEQLKYISGISATLY